MHVKGRPTRFFWQAAFFCFRGARCGPVAWTHEPRRRRNMKSTDLLIEAFGRIQTAVSSAVDGADALTLTYRADADANTIAWLVWHLARVQDDHVAELAGREQIWTRDGWEQRFSLPFDPSATGYGQSSAEVAAVRVDAELLGGYYDAV